MADSDEEKKTRVPRIWEACQECPCLIHHDRVQTLFKCACSDDRWMDRPVWAYHYVPLDCPRIMESIVLEQNLPDEDGEESSNSTSQEDKTAQKLLNFDGESGKSDDDKVVDKQGDTSDGKTREITDGLQAVPEVPPEL